MTGGPLVAMRIHRHAADDGIRDFCSFKSLDDTLHRAMNRIIPLKKHVNLPDALVKSPPLTEDRL